MCRVGGMAMTWEEALSARAGWEWTERITGWWELFRLQMRRFFQMWRKTGVARDPIGSRTPVES
ncbi:hypothetical protein JCM30471_03150 [Desulfuromonas carbonis]